jgi:hypothetical protein
MYEIGDFIRSRDNAKSLGLHVQTGTRHVNGRDTGEPIVWFVGSVPASLLYVPEATAKEIENGRKFGGRFGPAKRYYASTEAAWQEAERQGFARCPHPDCGCNRAA